MSESQQFVWPAARIKLLLAAFDFCLGRLASQANNPAAQEKHAQYAYLRGLFAAAPATEDKISLSINGDAKALIESAVAMYVASLQKNA